MCESVLQGALDLPLEQKKSLIECLKGAALAQMYMSTESVMVQWLGLDARLLLRPPA